MTLKKGDIVQIKSLKHGNHLHRLWKRSIVLQPTDPVILANDHVEVVNGDGSRFTFPCLAICHFARKDWFNIIMIYDDHFNLKKYYCNMASPYEMDTSNKVLSYVDYDLDLIVNLSKYYRWTDIKEYEQNITRYQYPEEVVENIKQARTQLIKKISQDEDPFNSNFAEYWYHQYDLLTQKGNVLLE